MSDDFKGLHPSGPIGPVSFVFWLIDQFTGQSCAVKPYEAAIQPRSIRNCLQSSIPYHPKAGKQSQPPRRAKPGARDGYDMTNPAYLAQLAAWEERKRRGQSLQQVEDGKDQQI
jgi:hypothetical protein